MKNAKKLLALVIALAMCLALGATAFADDASAEPLDLEALKELMTPEGYEDASWMVYDAALGEFYELLTAGQAETENLSLRYALLAQAEAKLDEQAVYEVTTNDGNRFAINSVIPHSDTSTTWGLDQYRLGYRMYADQLLTAEERNELLAAWGEAETEAEYYAFVNDWMEEKGYEFADSYRSGADAGPETWDVFATSRQMDEEFIAPTYASLVRYDGKNQIQPALAESWEVSEDGLTYTFHIREGAKWVDQQGREIADVTANDWVTGARHLADNSEALGYLYEPGYANIANWVEFITGEISDFSQVGVKAVDDYTLEYTLLDKTPYFLTMLGYGCFAPLNEEYYTSQGGTFGEGATSGDYGIDPSHIAYCGEFLIDNYTEGSVAHYVANPDYWDYENLNIHEINYTWYDSTDVMFGYNAAMKGDWVGCNLSTNTIVQAKQDKVEGSDESVFDVYAYISDADTTARQINYNLMRMAFANVSDDSKAVSPQTEEDAARTLAAMNNQDFRLAITFALDRAAYNAPISGEEMKSNSLSNTFVPGDFVQLTEDVTIDMGDGTEQTFPAGTFYGEIVQAQFEFDGFEAQAWDPEGNGGVGSSNSFDGWYKPEAAKAHWDSAVEALAAQGVEVSADSPIQIDLPYWSTNEIYTSRANIYKQSLEDVLGDGLVVNLIPCETLDDWYALNYYCSYGYECCYDIWDMSGWGPDYQDPTTYLNCYLPEYSGYLTMSSGIF